MLITLVRRFLAVYRGPLAVVVTLQFIGTVMALYLPFLNADIIDKGVVTGDTGYIVHIGALMLGVALRPDLLLRRRGLVRRAYGDGRSAATYGPRSSTGSACSASARCSTSVHPA